MFVRRMTITYGPGAGATTVLGWLVSATESYGLDCDSDLTGIDAAGERLGLHCLPSCGRLMVYVDPKKVSMLSSCMYTNAPMQRVYVSIMLPKSP